MKVRVDENGTCVCEGEYVTPDGRRITYRADIPENAVLFYVRRALANKGQRAHGGPMTVKVKKVG